MTSLPFQSICQNAAPTVHRTGLHTGGQYRRLRAASGAGKRGDKPDHHILDPLEVAGFNKLEDANAIPRPSTSGPLPREKHFPQGHLAQASILLTPSCIRPRLRSTEECKEHGRVS